MRGRDSQILLAGSGLDDLNGLALKASSINATKLGSYEPRERPCGVNHLADRERFRPVKSLTRKGPTQYVREGFFVSELVDGAKQRKSRNVSGRG